MKSIITFFLQTDSDIILVFVLLLLQESKLNAYFNI